MRVRPEAVHWLWKIPLAGLAYTAGATLAGGLAGALGVRLPELELSADPTLQMALLCAGGTAMAVGLAAMAIGIAGRWWQRWGLLAAFVLVVYGVGNALEGSIFTNIPGQFGLMWINVAAGGLCALGVSLLFAGPPGAGLARQFAAFRARWSFGGLAWRLLVGLLAFPFFYFLFGLLISPIVVPHYERLDFLTIPPMATMLQVLLARSAMFLVVSLAIVVAWRRSRAALVIGLGLGHFVTVGFAGLIQTTLFPAVLRWTHSIEILADSVFYAWVLAWLFLPRAREAGRHGRSERAEPWERVA